MTGGFFPRATLQKLVESVTGAQVAGQTDQGIEEYSLTQKFEIGTRKVVGLRTYRYALADGAQIPDVGSQVGPHQAIEGATCTVAATVPVGATTVTINKPALAGATHDGVFAANELVGGHIVFYVAPSNKVVFRGIKANSASVAGAAVMTIELDAPTPTQLVITTTTCEAMHSPYYKVKTGASGLRATIGIPAVPAPDKAWFWLQTWGPCWVAPQAGLGNAANSIEAVFNSVGSVDEHAYGTAGLTKQQHAGFVLTTNYAGTQGAPFIWLMLAP